MQDRSPTADAAGLAAAAALLVLAAALYAALLDWQTSDALAWFVPWLDHIAAHGSVASLAAPLQVQVEGAGTPANDNPPYLYLLIAASPAYGMLGSLTLVKLVSIAGTLLCAACLHALLRVHVGPQRALLGALGMLLLPTVALNAAACRRCTTATSSSPTSSPSRWPWCGRLAGPSAAPSGSSSARSAPVRRISWTCRLPAIPARSASAWRWRSRPGSCWARCARRRRLEDAR
jgi:hypothetical protein